MARKAKDNSAGKETLYSIQPTDKNRKADSAPDQATRQAARPRGSNSAPNAAYDDDTAPTGMPDRGAERGI